jgi:hypothetical protein
MVEMACPDNPARRPYSYEERRERASLRAAMHIRGLWEEKGSSDTRLLEGLFYPDEFAVVGRSLKYEGKGRREHVIPRRIVVNECHAMLECGESDIAIARFIREHVKIVLISKEEQERLDSRHHFALRQIMPEGWAFGDGVDIFARLKHAGIEWTSESHAKSETING